MSSHCPPAPDLCGVPSERMGFMPSVPGVSPRAGMHTPRWGDYLSQRDTAYQPRVQPWVFGVIHPRVLKERRMSSHCPPAPDLCGVPSERMGFMPSVPGVSPRAGMHTPRWGDYLSQRDTAYQPRVQPWVFGVIHPRVLKERHITSDGHQTCEHPQYGAPSERSFRGARNPELHSGLGCDAPVGALVLEHGCKLGVALRAGLRCPG